MSAENFKDLLVTLKLFTRVDIGCSGIVIGLPKDCELILHSKILYFDDNNYNRDKNLTYKQYFLPNNPILVEQAFANGVEFRVDLVSAIICSYLTQHYSTAVCYIDVFLQLQKLIQNYKNLCFEIKIGPLKSIERCFFKMFEEIIQSKEFEEFLSSNDINYTRTLWKLNNLIYNNRVKDIYRMTVFIGDDQKLKMELKEFSNKLSQWGNRQLYTEKQKIFQNGDLQFNVTFINIREFIEIQIIKTSYLFKDHKEYELERLIKIKNEFDNMLIGGTKNLILHCYQKSIEGILK